MWKRLTMWTILICEKNLKDTEIREHDPCFLRNVYGSQGTTVKTGLGKTGWFKIRKEVHQGCIWSPCLFNLYAEYIMQNTELDKSQSGIRIARRNISNHRFADDITLMTESEEKLKSIMMKMNEGNKKAGLKLNIQKNLDHSGWSQHFMANIWEKVKTVTDFIFFGLKTTVDSD